MVLQGSIESVDPADYYSVGFTGDLEKDDLGKYVIRGSIFYNVDESKYSYLFVNTSEVRPFVFVSFLDNDRTHLQVYSFYSKCFESRNFALYL